MEDRFKVRLWDITERKFAKVTEIDYYPDLPDGSDIFVHYSGDRFDTLLDEENLENCILEQCTGLKDKNGKLIYEGDIVETHDYTTEHSEIVFDKGCYVLKSKDAAMYEHLSNYEKKCEIIGNIHENPELLEEK